MNTEFEKLVQLGLSDKEAQIYISLLKIGSSSVADLSRVSGIKRTTVHSNVEALLQKGLVTQTSVGGRRMLLAEVPEKLQDYIDQKEINLEEIKKTLPDLVHSLYGISKEHNTLQKSIVRYYEGKKGLREVCQRSLDFAKSDILFISNLDEWYKIYTDEFDNTHYIPSRIQRNIRLKLLTFKTPKTSSIREDDRKLLRETRFLSKKFSFNSTMLIYADEVSITTSSLPYMAIVIENKEVAKMFRNMFLGLWASNMCE